MIRGVVRRLCLLLAWLAAWRLPTGACPDPGPAAAAFCPAGRHLDPHPRPDRRPHRPADPAAGRDRCAARTGDRRADGGGGLGRTRPRRSRRHQAPAGAPRTQGGHHGQVRQRQDRHRQARARPAARQRRGQGRAPASHRPGGGQREPGQAVRGDRRARRPAARAPEQAAQPARDREPAAPQRLAAVERRLDRGCGRSSRPRPTRSPRPSTCGGATGWRRCARATRT